MTTNRFKDGGGVPKQPYSGNIQNWTTGGVPLKYSNPIAKDNSTSATLAWLKGIRGKIPYRLGANGPGAFDCSSLVGEVWARLTHHPQNRRYFVTGTEKAWSKKNNFRPGVHIADALQIGWNSHHTTGALAGHPFEAAHTGTTMRFGPGATSPTTFPNKAWLPVGKGNSLLDGLLGFIMNLAGKGIGYLTTPINWLLDRIPGLKNFRTGSLGKAVSGKTGHAMMPVAIKKLGDKITHAAEEKERAAEAALAASQSSGAPTNLTLGHGKFNSWVSQASKFVNIPPSWLPLLLKIMRAESGGNPNAINRSDSNARAGHPSRGLMQLIPATFKSNHAKGTSGSIVDPVANIAAAINYIHRKYGTIFNTPWNHGGSYYAKGGFVGGPLLRDNGGVLPPGDWLIQNHTGKNEYISRDSSEYKELHVHVGDEHFVAQIDDRIDKNNNDMIKYIITRHH
jgi:cell wall-associated NlpC family hydrolase